MSIINLLLELSPALEKGKALANKETWSNVVTIKNAIYTVLAFALLAAKTFGYDLPISDSQLLGLAAAIASIAEPVAGFLHITTNAHVGITKK